MNYCLFQPGALKQKNEPLETAFGNMIIAQLPSVQVRRDTFINLIMHYVSPPLSLSKKWWGLRCKRKKHHEETQDHKLTLQMRQGMKSLRPDLSTYTVLHLRRGKYLHLSQNRHLPAPAGNSQQSRNADGKNPACIGKQLRVLLFSYFFPGVALSKCFS